MVINQLFTFLIIFTVPHVLISYVLIVELILGFASISTLKRSYRTIKKRGIKNKSLITFLVALGTIISNLIPLFDQIAGLELFYFLSFLIGWFLWVYYFIAHKFFHKLYDRLRNSRVYLGTFGLIIVLYIIAWPIMIDVWYIWYDWDTNIILIFNILNIVFFAYGILLGYKAKVLIV